MNARAAPHLLTLRAARAMRQTRARPSGPQLHRSQRNSACWRWAQPQWLIALRWVRWFRSGPRLLAVLLLWWMTSGTALAWQTGEKIEWIPVRMLDGSTVNPSQLQGRFVFIQVWATWCPYCRLQNAALPELVRRWQQKGGVVLTLASDKTEKTVHAYLRAKQLQFPVAHITPDVRGWLGRTRIVPTVFIVGPDGSVLKTIEGQMLEDDLYELADLLQAPNGGTLSQ